VVLRCTVKALKLLGLRPAALAEVEAGDDDWYLNLLWFDRRKCLLLVHAGTLFPVFAPDVRKADIVPFPAWVARTVAANLQRAGLPAHVLSAVDADTPVGKTASRRVLGFMNDMAVHIDYAVAAAGSLHGCDEELLNRALRDVPYQVAGEYVTASDLLQRRLRTRQA
jgi:hypothetical protein